MIYIEDWKEIDNSGYFISNMGRIKTIDRYVTSHKGNTEYTRFQKGGILKGGVTLNGYHFIKLNDGKNHFIHQLVAKYFIDNPYGYSEVNHKDENKNNNSVENLEWCSHKYNCNYGSRKNGNKDKTKKVMRISQDGSNKIYNSLVDAENDMGYRGCGIGKCCRGDLKSYKGYMWKYV